MRAALCAVMLLCFPICARAESTAKVSVTLFGFADNDPPGTAIAHPIIHRGAGGTGTYDDPITFASNPARIAPGTRIYVPYLQKYFIMEDDCATAIKRGVRGGLLVDLWAGGTSRSNYQRLMAAESAHTRGTAEIIVNPSSNHPVNSTPLFRDYPVSEASR
jgi:hypothetical protein